jgi:hypothetical protein
MATSHNEEDLPKRSVRARVLRFPLKLLIYAVVLVVRPVRAHPKVAAVGTVIVGVGVAVWYSVTIAPTQAVNHAATATSAVAESAAPRITTQSPLPSAIAPINYLRGMSMGDAHLMWLQLSQDSGGSGVPTSEEAIRTYLLKSQETLSAIREIVYVGGSKLDDGTSVYMYVLSLRSPSTGEEGQVPITFTLDPNGKITRIQ